MRDQRGQNIRQHYENQVLEEAKEGKERDWELRSEMEYVAES